MKNSLKRKLGIFLCASMLFTTLMGCSNTTGETPKETSTTEVETETEAPQEEAETSTDAAKFTAGTYVGEGEGYGGPLKVEVTVTDDAISTIAVTEHSETEGIGSVAVEQLPATIVEAQSLSVDAVSGCTISSMAILAGVESALEQSGADIQALKNSTAPAADDSDVTVEDTETDVVVIGAGAAGLAAANTVRKAGKNVILLEKRGITGGNSAMAGKFDAGGTKAHTAAGETYSAQEHFESVVEEVKDAGTTADEAFIKFFTDNAGPAVDWLIDDFGVEFNKIIGKELYGEPRASGQAITKMTDAAAASGVDIRYNNRATELVATDGKVTGVKVSTPQGDYTITANAVVLASGGYAASDELLARYVPDWAGTPTSNTDESTGDGVLMAEAIGADISAMESVTINPTFYDNNGTTVSASGVRYNGGILVDKTNGKRFADEMGDYTKAAMAEKALPEGSAWAILDEKSVGTNVDRAAAKADTVEELAELIGVDKDGLVKTITDYQGYFDKGADPEFGKTDFRARLDTPPYYAVSVFPGIHNTHGGVTIDIDTRVLDKEGNIIANLYAAGDVANNKLFGAEALTSSVVNGRRAGEMIIEQLG